MQPWIGELQEAALERGPGATDEAFAAAVERIGTELPEELWALYAAMNGALLPGEVRLLPAEGWTPVGAAVQLGHRAGAERLLAVRRGDLYGLASGEPIPAWVEALEPDAWVYAVVEGDSGPLRIHRTLQRMLEVLVPPRTTEEFGELTFARALNAVQEALGILGKARSAPEAEVRTGPAAGGRARAKAPPKRSAARRGGSAKKAAARTKRAAGKKKAGRKRTSRGKKSAARPATKKRPGTPAAVRKGGAKKPASASARMTSPAKAKRPASATRRASPKRAQKARRPSSRSPRR